MEVNAAALVVLRDSSDPRLGAAYEQLVAHTRNMMQSMRRYTSKQNAADLDRNLGRVRTLDGVSTKSGGAVANLIVDLAQSLERTVSSEPGLGAAGLASELENAIRSTDLYIKENANDKVRGIAIGAEPIPVSGPTKIERLYRSTTAIIYVLLGVPYKEPQRAAEFAAVQRAVENLIGRISFVVEDQQLREWVEDLRRWQREQESRIRRLEERGERLSVQLTDKVRRLRIAHQKILELEAINTGLKAQLQAGDWERDRLRPATKWTRAAAAALSGFLIAAGANVAADWIDHGLERPPAPPVEVQVDDIHVACDQLDTAVENTLPPTE